MEDEAPPIGRVAVVTGASSGIGAAIACHLQDAGYTVVALARRLDSIADAVDGARLAVRAREQERQRQLAAGAPKGGLLSCFKRGHRQPPPGQEPPEPGNLHCLACDVAQEEDVLRAFGWVQEHLKRLDLLVNNAGVGGPHSLAGADNASSEEWKRILDVNIMGLSLCTREALKLMREGGADDGHVVHICSVAGHISPQGGGEQSMYFASKHAVRVLTEGLRKELVAAKSKIRVTEVSPGMVKTNFFDAMNIGGDLLWSVPHLFPEDVANAVLYTVGTPSHVQIHEIIVKPVGEHF